MASAKSPLSIKILLFFHLLCIFCFLQTHSISGSYASIFSFGNSLADTGNFLLTGAVRFPFIGRLPYGETYFHYPTGRCSDGRLIVDFIADAYGLPKLLPYLSPHADFRQGVNFAVAGATALDPIFFQERNLTSAMWTNISLSIQLGWFDHLKPSLCYSTEDCTDYFGKSLFLMGEIGGNDYNYALLQGTSIEEVQTFVPKVVEAIESATSRLIEQGAVDLVVPGNLPIGCSTIYLTFFLSPNKADYDQYGCIKTLNRFSEYHNTLLQHSLEKLRQKYPRTKIIYADYYGAAMRFFRFPLQFGFSSGALSACCGGGGPYNFNNSAPCGSAGSSVCSDPSTYVNWDGIHLTDAAYRAIATGLVYGPYSTPPMASPHLS
ncbi:GDSL esterase/lipase At5g45910-like [Magnolia sinica]|uniref:GDSL esterase/lipase At5g45910-like n=1 Tax=Magnolia sinica TaxID=86752 RepID=UPI00265B202C|nr:GDSL esterase/lipase At5g45910-like [Magnolia sinica]